MDIQAAVDCCHAASRVEGTGNPDIKSRACLLVGTLPGNKLLACRPLCLETFPSPLVLRLKTSIPWGSVGLSVSGEQRGLACAPAARGTLLASAPAGTPGTLLQGGSWQEAQPRPWLVIN